LAGLSFQPPSNKGATSENIERFRQSVHPELARQVPTRPPLSDTRLSLALRFFAKGEKDLDRLINALPDALTGALFQDDEQVIEIHTKIWKNTSDPRMLVEFEAFSDTEYTDYLAQGMTTSELKRLVALMENKKSSHTLSL
jgi:Holliday junction resolvase RusA-like endonuclease